MNPNARASLLILGAAAFMVSADARVIDPLLDTIAKQFHSPVGKASIVISAYTLPYGLFQLFYGPLGDRIGKLKVKAITLFLFAFGTAACAFVPNLTVFAILRFLTGVVAAAIIPLSLAYIGDKFPYEERQAALGRFMSALMLGQIISASLGGIFGQYIGWQGIFLLFGAISLIVSAGIWRESKRLPEEPKAQTGSLFDLSRFKPIVEKPASRLVLITVMLEGLFLFGALPYQGVSLIRRFHLGEAQVGFMLASYGIGGLIYSFTVKKVIAKLKETGMLILGGTLLAIAFVGVAFIPNWFLFIPCALLMGIGFNSLHGTLQTKATEMAPTARGTAVSLFAFSLFMGQSLGAFLMGHIFEAQGYQSVFMIAGIGLGTIAFVASILFPRLSSKKSANGKK